jgi:hypothetical protein
MLHMTGELGTFEDGSMCNMQRVNRNLHYKLSEDAHNAQQFFMLPRARLEITSRMNGMLKGNSAKVKLQVVENQAKITVKR